MLKKFHITFPYSSLRYLSVNPAVKINKAKTIPIITCKRTEFNLFQHDKINLNAKFGKIPLASDGWKHRKSKNDHFIIHPTPLLDFENTENNQIIFEDLSVDPKIIENLKKNNIIKPTSIQSKAFENILRAEHTLIAAETGCGKTYAYLIPIIQQIIELKKQYKRNFNTPLGLILTPGRELASQIGSVAEQLVESLNLNVKVILGGRTKQLMLNPTFEDVDLVVASVGAISKLVTTGIYRMNHVRHVVLDEADTLLDDSFNEKMGYFLKKFPFHKNHLQDISQNIVGTQLILASATMPTNVEELIGTVLDTKTLIEVVSPDLHKILSHVQQKFLRMNKSDRPINLLNLIKNKRNLTYIIFSNKSATSDFVSMFLNGRDVKCVNLNGDMLMQHRIGKFEEFQSGATNILSTTDIASRGLDTTRADRIINFDFPLHVADYIHRCGRTGRVGSPKNSQIINFVSSLREIELVQKIEHAARTTRLLPNVNANITNIITSNIQKQIDREKHIL